MLSVRTGEGYGRRGNGSSFGAPVSTAQGDLKEVAEPERVHHVCAEKRVVRDEVEGFLVGGEGLLDGGHVGLDRDDLEVEWLRCHDHRLAERVELGKSMKG